MVNRKMKPMANSMGVSKVMEPRHMVAVQLNTFTPVGTAIIMVAYAEQLAGDRHASGEHVMRPDDAGQDGDGCGGVYHRRIPEQRLARKRGDNLDVMPNAGRIMM